MYVGTFLFSVYQFDSQIKKNVRRINHFISSQLFFIISTYFRIGTQYKYVPKSRVSLIKSIHLKL